MATQVVFCCFAVNIVAQNIVVVVNYLAENIMTKHTLVTTIYCLVALVLTAVIAVSGLWTVVANATTQDNHNNTHTSTKSEVVPNYYNLYDYNSGDTHLGVSFQGQYFGTTEYTKLPFTITIYNNAVNKDSAEMISLAKQIHATIDRLDQIANTQYTTSDVYKFNNAVQGQTIEVTKEMADMIQTAKKMYELTNGAYNPASYRLVDLWGFSSRTYYMDGNLPYDRQWVENADGTYGYPTPEQKYIDAFIQLADFNSVQLTEEDGKYYLTKNCAPVTVDGVEYQQWIDLGGIAKGYAVDEVKTLLNDAGMNYYFINGASSSMAMTTDQPTDGNPQGRAFKLGITSPDSIFMSYCALEVSNSNVSTSGQYVRKYSYNGTEYAHIIDSKSGYPAQAGISTVTIIGGTAAENDCLTTALTVLGAENMVEFMNSAYAWENKLTIVGIYEQPSAWDKKRPIIANLTTESFLEIDTDSFFVGTTITKTTDSQLIEQGIEYFVTLNLSQNMDMTTVALIVVLSLALVLAIAIGVYRTIINRNKGRKFNVVAVKNDRAFRFGDALVYVLLLVLIVVLFVVFVFTRTTTAIKTVKIISTTTGQTLFTYDAQTNVYSTATTQDYQIDVDDSDSQLVVTITLKDSNTQRSNTATITKGDNVSVKMTDSQCGLHQECVRNFPAITSADGVIVCSPNGLKITTSDTADYILI